MPGFQYAVPGGLQMLQGLVRTSSSADDVQAFVKTSLVRLDDRQQSLVSRAWRDRGGQVPPGAVPDLFGPFATLVRTLLPHLEWVGVASESHSNIQCLFRPAGAQTPLFDIDELSSGEKAALALLLPFVERQADQLVVPASVPAGIVPVTMLIDEPEIHLHPLLQLQLLDYLRSMAGANAAQFILATQPPTLLDALADDELWLVSPAGLRPGNQLSRLTTSQERLEVARTITGSTHLLTRAKPIVFLEGEAERPGVASDARLTALLLPETRSWALVPGRAKHDVIEAVQQLRHQDLDLPGMPVFGLVDADRDQPPDDDHIIVWPVAMIENLLVDADAIHQALEPFGAQTSATDPKAVRAVIDHLVAGRVEDEVRLRVQRRLPVGRLHLCPAQVDDAEQVARTQTAKWLSKLQELDVTALTEEARAEVAVIRSAGHELDRFHGKRLLRALYNELHVRDAGLSVSAFHIAVAAHAVGTERVQRLAHPAVQRVQLYFPDELGSVLRTDGGEAAEALARECDQHRAAWQRSAPLADGREQLRAAVFSYAGTRVDPQRGKAVALASEIGTP